MSRNKLIIASAGAGKTTYLVEKAFDILAKNSKVKILITTYTRSNTDQIRQKIKQINFDRNGFFAIPSGLIVQEWFTFLMREGIRPFKSIMDQSLKYRSIGLYPNFQYNLNQYKSPNDIIKHYFVDYKIVPNALSEFVYNSDKKSSGEVISRLSSTYSFIFIDEVQDLAGYDLELIRLFIKSPINVLLVGDPRQVTYLTNQPKLNRPYKEGKIEKYVSDKCSDLNVIIDTKSLKESHRNNKLICDFSSKLYSQFEKSEPCSCDECRTLKHHLGIYIIRKSDVEKCKKEFESEEIGILRWQQATSPEKTYGDSKGLTYDRVFIYPTGTIIKYLKTGELLKEIKNKKTGKIELKDAFDIPKLYVAITRARHSVFFIHDYEENDIFISGVQKY